MAETAHEERRLPTVPGLGMASANLLRLVRLSAPNWFKIPGSNSVSCLVSACPVIVKVLAAKEAWTFGLLKWITVPWLVNIFTYSQKKKKHNQLGRKHTFASYTNPVNNAVLIVQHFFATFA